MELLDSNNSIISVKDNNIHSYCYLTQKSRNFQLNFILGPTFDVTSVSVAVIPLQTSRCQKTSASALSFAHKGMTHTEMGCDSTVSVHSILITEN